MRGKALWVEDLLSPHTCVRIVSEDSVWHNFPLIITNPSEDINKQLPAIVVSVIGYFSEAIIYSPFGDI